MDAYDPQVAFDDLYGAFEARGPRSGQEYAKILRSVGRRRLAVPHRVEALGYDYTPWSFELLGCTVLGASPTHKLGLPLLDAISGRFAEAIGEPRAVRVDDESSYSDFRQSRRLAKLEDRLAKLERAVSEHVADNHGAGRLARLEEAFQDHVADGHGGHSDEVLGEVIYGGSPVPLPLPDWARGKVECWRDGSEVLCTIRFCDNAGKLKLATSATPLAPHVEEVVGCADRLLGEDSTLEDVGFFIPFIPILGGVAVLRDLCGAAQSLVACSDRFVGALVPDVDPQLAGAMALIQRCQRRDQRACAEAQVLAAMKPELFERARERLTSAQERKARQL